MEKVSSEYFIKNTKIDDVEIPGRRILVDVEAFKNSESMENYPHEYIRCGIIVGRGVDLIRSLNEIYQSNKRSVIKLGDVVFFHVKSGVDIHLEGKVLVLFELDTEILAVKRMG